MRSIASFPPRSTQMRSSSLRLAIAFMYQIRMSGAAEGYLNKDQCDREDRALNYVREFIENHFGQLDQLFPYMCSKRHNKIASSMPIKEIAFCRVLLRNCHVCLYENQTSKRFGLEPPTGLFFAPAGHRLNVFLRRRAPADLGRDTRTSTQSCRFVRRNGASWSLNWPSGANLLAQRQHMYFFCCFCDYYVLVFLCYWKSIN